MLTRMALGALLALVFQLQIANAAEENNFAASTESEVTASEGQAVPHVDNQDTSRSIHWDFITCVCTSRECYDEALYHNYPHYKVVDDHFTCPGHEHLACYGGHH